MSHHNGMQLDPRLSAFTEQPFTPSSTPGQGGEQDPNQPIPFTLAMYNEVMNRLAYTESRAESLLEKCATLEETCTTLRERCVTLGERCTTLGEQGATLLSQCNMLASRTPTGNPSALEPKMADAPTFNGNRKELIPFLTKCRLKFGGQPSRFQDERAKVMYAGARLEGSAFGWFQPLVARWDTTGVLPPPAELSSFETFATELTALYGDPNLAASAEREICQLRQTSTVANYTAKFEQHRQYLEWNDAALRDQFYRGLKDEIKDELAPRGRPETLAKLKEIASRLDARLQERALERKLVVASQPTQRLAPKLTYAPPQAPSKPPPYPRPAAPTTALRTPMHTSDGTVPMEIGAQGLWQLTAAEKLRRKQLNLCNYCGIAGHDVWGCPSKPKGPPPRFAQQAVVSLELPEEGPSEKDDTQE